MREVPEFCGEREPVKEGEKAGRKEGEEEVKKS